ncbi:MAG: tocopherol cyclase family protein [Bacillus subtilis]|nr:tocopherol cyclase family protein [Bacillus subtilis]
MNDFEISFEHGRGYLEKDWGTSFPQGYVWLQTNHFTSPGTSLMASVARIPFLGFAFQGFLVNFVHAGKEISICDVQPFETNRS